MCCVVLKPKQKNGMVALKKKVVLLKNREKMDDEKFVDLGLKRCGERNANPCQILNTSTVNG